MGCLPGALLIVTAPVWLAEVNPVVGRGPPGTCRSRALDPAVLVADDRGVTISREQVMPLILRACPSFLPAWRKIENDDSTAVALGDLRT
jgi:hypothetical protein